MILCRGVWQHGHKSCFCPGLVAPSQWRAVRHRRKPTSTESDGIAAGDDGGASEPDHAPPSTSRATSQKPSSNVPDFVFGVSVRRHVVGYALLHFQDLSPLQFGIVDVRKTLEVQQKALEIQAAFRQLREEAPLKLQRLSSEAVEVSPASGKWQWLITIDDSTADRAPPTTASQSAMQRAIAMLQGLVIADCRRLFKIAPILLHPKRSRQHLGVRGQGTAARQAIFDLAKREVTDFPEIVKRGGKLNEDSFLMSDAWASARLAQRERLVTEKRGDLDLMAKLRHQVMLSKDMRKLKEAVEELHPRKAGRELSDVLESRVVRAIDTLIHQMLDRDLRRRGERLVRAAS